jgi:hypothetical protein
VPLRGEQHSRGDSRAKGNEPIGGHKHSRELSLQGRLEGSSKGDPMHSQALGHEPSTVGRRVPTHSPHPLIPVVPGQWLIGHVTGSCAGGTSVRLPSALRSLYSKKVRWRRVTRSAKK